MGIVVAHHAEIAGGAALLLSSPSVWFSANSIE
jgi:hypothetical protein